MNAEYKILLYVDSTGCSNCRLKLASWRHLIEEADSLFKDKLSFLFFFQPKNKKEMTYLFIRDNFNYPAFIDENNKINQLNHFPERMEYQCFFLDKDNKVLMIGNPALNFRIWKLYKQTISERAQADVMPVTKVSIEHAKFEIKDLQTGKTSEAAFTLQNTGTQPLVIQMVDASCGCTVPVWEKQPVAAGKSTEIKVQITPEEKGYFNKTITVHCNVEKGRISLNITGVVDD
jgi:hypothetical protein